jgi:tRNA pseudouridine55 synthase
VPPAFSAIQKDGERAYARARRGEAVALAAREVRVRALEVVACNDEPPWLTVRVEVDKGYYVRALARDLATALATVGHLTALRRTRSGCFTLDEALPLDTPDDELAARVEHLTRAASRALPVARLSEVGARDAHHGRPVQPADIDAPVAGPSAWLAPHGELVAVGEVGESGVGRVLRGFG